MKKIVIFSGLSLALTLFGYLFVSHHRDMPDRIQQHRVVLLGGGSTVAERIKPVGQVHIVSAKPEQTRTKPVQAAAPARAERNGEEVYQTTCAVCHEAGIAGAPKVGDAALWAERIGKGVDALYASAINGMQGSAGVMPPKGGNPSLSDAEVKAAVDHIVARSK